MSENDLVKGQPCLQAGPGIVPIFALAVFVIVFFSCAKKNDIAMHHDIKGMVFNNCTDSGLAGVTVYMETFKNEKLVDKRSTVSVEDGKFEFADVPVYSEEIYSYALHIPSRPGTNAQKPGEESFTGTTMYFSNAERSHFFQPRVTPGFLFLCYTSNITFPLPKPDSIYIYFYQPVFHKNVPGLPYSGVFTNSSSLESCTSNYPMGKWYFETAKWKNGNRTFARDSIYLGQGGQATYTIAW